MEKILKWFKGEIKGVNEETKTLQAVISTVSEDRDGDVVLPASFRHSLGEYMKHPVLLADHNYYDLRKQIGKAKAVQINPTDVVAEFEYFVGKGNPEADWAWELAKQGLASFSIGFMGLEYEDIYKSGEDGRQYFAGRKFTKIELMEVSQVLIPSNRGALQASADLMEMACKSVKEGSLKMPEVVKEVAEKKEEVQEVKEPNDEKAHYSETILGEAEETPNAEPDKNAIKEAIKQGFNEAYKTK